MIFFTADYHLSHTNCIKYCSRPFKDATNPECENRKKCTGCSSYLWCTDKMNEAIIRNHNSRVAKDDIVYHVGDFCFKGGLEGGSDKASFWESKLNGKIIHILGNHDRNNSVKSLLKICVIEFANKVILVQHKPPTMRLEVPDFIDYVICGHVHEKWKYKWLEDINNSIPIINVGIDQWKYMPVKIDEVNTYYNRIIKERKKENDNILSKV